MHDLAPQPRGLEHVGLVDARDAPCARRAKATRAIRSISSTRVGAEVAGAGRGARLRAEVDAAGQLAHDQQVGAGDPLLAQRARRVQRLDRAHRAAGSRTARGPCAPRAGPARDAACDGSVVSHFGPPTAPEQHRVGARGRRRAPRRSARRRERRSRRRRRGAPRSRPRATAASTSSPAAITSGPMPSPGSVTIRRHRVAHRSSPRRVRRGLDTPAHEQEPRRAAAGSSAQRADRASRRSRGSPRPRCGTASPRQPSRESRSAVDGDRGGPRALAGARGL